jgi:hypothetical protein
MDGVCSDDTLSTADEAAIAALQVPERERERERWRECVCVRVANCLFSERMFFGKVLKQAHL